MKKIILPGLVAGLAILISDFLFTYLFMLIPAVKADYCNANLMRSWDDPLMSLFFLYPFVLGIALSWAWPKTEHLFKGSAFGRALNFGLFYFAIATVPGMLATYASFHLSLLTVASWTFNGLFDPFLAGLVFGRMKK